MWLAKPVYEALPLCYAGAGLAALGASAMVPPGIWSEGLFIGGLVGAAAGLALHLKRRGYRSSRSRRQLERQG